MTITGNEGVPGTLGWAIRQAVGGHRIRRRGWNGPDQWVYYLHHPVSEHRLAKDKVQRPILVIDNGNGQQQMGWSPSIGDTLATDWEVA